MALHHNPSSLAFNLNSTSLPRSLSSSPPRFSHGVEISVAPLLSASDQVVNSSSLSPSASGGQIFSPEYFLPDQFPHGYMRPTGNEGSTSSFVHLPASLGLGNGCFSRRFSHVVPPLFVSEQAHSSSLSLSSPRGQIFSPDQPTQTTINHDFMASPPRGNSTARDFFDEATKDPVHVADPEKMTRRASDVVAVAGYPGFGIPDASKVRSVIPGFGQITNPRNGFQVTNAGVGFRVSAAGPLGPIVPTGSTPIFSTSLRPIPAIRNTDKGKAPALSPPQSFDDASNFFQAVQLDAVHTAAPRATTRPVGHAAGPSRSAIPYISGPVTKQGLDSHVSSGPIGPTYGGPINPAQSADPSSVIVNILSTLSKTQAEQEQRARIVSERSYNLSRQFIQVKHGALLRIDNCNSLTSEALLAVNAQAQAIETKNDEADPKFARVIEERNAKIGNLQSELLNLKEEREKEKVKEEERSKEKKKKYLKYTLMGIGGAFSLGIGLGAFLSVKK